MAFTSYGYDGRMAEGAFAQVAAFIKPPVVATRTDLASTIVPAGDREVSVAAGRQLGHGVLAIETAPTVVQSDTATGTRYDTIAVHRDWQGTGGTTTIVVVEGGTSLAVAGTIDTNVGVEHDDPIALAKIVDASLTELIDMREFLSHGGERLFGSTTARDYRIPSPYKGEQCRVLSGSTSTRYTFDGSSWIATQTEITVYGNWSMTFNAGKYEGVSGPSGYPHGLGGTPTTATARVNSDNTSYTANAFAIGSTTLRISARRIDGNAQQSTGTLSGTWEATRVI